MDQLKAIICDFKYQNGIGKMDQLFNLFKPILLTEIETVMDSKISYSTKPRTKVENFVNAFYGMLDEGGKYKNIKRKYGLSSGCYSGYLKICYENKILETFHSRILTEFSSFITADTTTDTFTVRAKGAQDAKGYHHKEKSKVGTSVSIVSDLNRIPLSTYADAGNIDDRKMLSKTLEDPRIRINCKKNMFADKGYTGREFKNTIDQTHQINLICPPKKVGGPSKKSTPEPATIRMTHILTEEEAIGLKNHRNKIEHVNQIFRNFRSVDIRYTKNISTYLCYISFACVLTTIMKLKDVVVNSSS